MKIPRDLTGLELINLLRPFGYEVIRQTGSHIRVQTTQNGQHYETIPHHDPIKIGTLNNILKNIADHFDLIKKNWRSSYSTNNQYVYTAWTTYRT